MTYTLRAGTVTVPRVKAEQVYDLSDKIGEETIIEYYFSKSPKSLAAALGLDPDEVAPFQERIAAASELLRTSDPAARLEAMTLLNALASDVPRPSVIAGVVDGMKGAALVDARRLPAAKAALESMSGQYQGNFDLLRLLMLLQIDDKKPADAVRTIALITEHHPDKVTSLEQETISRILSLLRQDGSDDYAKTADDFMILLAKAGWQQSPMTEQGDDVRMAAIKHLLERGALDEARKLFALSPVSSENAAELAADKRYSALWPDLAPAVRDHFRSLIENDVDRSSANLASSPDDLKLLTVHLRNLRRAGRSEEALSIGKSAVFNRGRIEAAGADGFWLVNEYAYALKDEGLLDKAVAQMDWIVSLDVDQYPDLISQAINRAEMLNSNDRPADALEAFQALDSNSAGHASIYGRMWIWSGTVCAAHEVAEPSLVEKAMDQIKGNTDANPSAATMALACLSDIEGLEDIYVKRLDDPKQRNAALGAFARTLAEPRSKFETRMQGIFEQIAARPAVQAKLEQYGRVVQFDGKPTYWGGF